MTKTTNEPNKIPMKSITEQLGIEERIIKNRYISGRSNTITGLGEDALLENSVSTNQIIDDAINTAKILDESVTPDKLFPTYTSASLGASFTSTATASFQDTGLKITLSEIGVYVVSCNLRVGNNATLNDYAVVQLYNETTASAVTDSERIGNFPTAGNQVTVPLHMIVPTTTVNNVVRIEIKPNAARTCQLLANSDGRSTMLAFRIG